MPIKQKKHIADLHRVANASFNRSSYLSLDRNENVIGFSGEVLQDLCSLITPDLVSSYPDVKPLNSLIIFNPIEGSVRKCELPSIKSH